MASAEALRVGYVVLFSTTGAVTLVVGTWVYARVTVSGRRAFTAHMLVDSVWAWTAALGVVVPGRSAQFLVTVLGTVFALTAVVTWLVFAMQYTDRDASLGRPLLQAVFAGYLVLAGGALTNHLHELYWSGMVYHQSPFPYVETTFGSLGLLGLAFAFSLLGLGLYYLGELFVRSDHRSTVPVAVLLVATLVSVLPNVASRAGLVPVPGYDHTPIGIATFVVFAAYAIFRLGMFDIEPVAREQLVEQADDALFVLDAEKRLVDFNPATAEIVPGIDADAVGRPVDQIAPDLADRIDLVDGLTATATEQFSVVRADGRRHFSVRVSPITDDDSLVAYSVILREVTDLVESHRELKRQNEQLDDFAESITHDIRNPLQVATGNVEAMDQRLDRIDDRTDDDEVDQHLAAARRALDHTESALDRLQTTVDELRSLAEHGQSVETTDAVAFERVVTDAWQYVDADGDALVTVGDGTIQADARRLGLVLENLLRYCVQRDAAPVTVEVVLTDDGFVVRDDGSSIPESDRDRLFDYGYTPASSSSRLGLQIVGTLVESHGWTVYLDASYDGGACFVVEDAITTIDTDGEDTVIDVSDP